MPDRAIRHPAQNRAVTPKESIPEHETRAHADTNRGWRNRYEDAYAYVLAMGFVGLLIDLVFASITRLQIVESAAMWRPEES